MLVKKTALETASGDLGYCVVCGALTVSRDEPHKEGCPVAGESKTLDVRPFVPGIIVESHESFEQGASGLFTQMLQIEDITEAEFDNWVNGIKDKALDEHSRAVGLFQSKPMFHRLVHSIVDLVRTDMIDPEELGCLFRAVRDLLDPH